MTPSGPEFGAIRVAECDLGHGVFAGRDFREGELLFQFTGPLISLAQAIEKGEAEGNVLQIGAMSYIDLEAPSVFVNHCCQPNAGVRDLVCAYALRPIGEGEQIFYDYSTTMSEQRWTMKCRCGAASCRGLIYDFHDLPAELQQRYLAMGIVQPFIVAESGWLRRGPNPLLESGASVYQRPAPASENDAGVTQQLASHGIQLAKIPQ